MRWPVQISTAVIIVQDTRSDLYRLSDQIFTALICLMVCSCSKVGANCHHDEVSGLHYVRVAGSSVLSLSSRRLRDVEMKSDTFLLLSPARTCMLIR
jgi:hypothetical protein